MEMEEVPDFSEYRKFLEGFHASVDLTDQLPVRIPSYSPKLCDLPGEIMDYTYQYLSSKQCPPTLITQIVKIVLKEMNESCQHSPERHGYHSISNRYEPLKLMQSVIIKISNVCQRLLDNAKMDMISPPPPPEETPPRYAVNAIKNGRRKMEDRHTIIDDLNTVCGIETNERASYYAIFDGHGGVDAANFGVAHLHYYLANSGYYPSNPAEAMRWAIKQTDCDFCYDASGATVVCALYRPVEKRLYVGWLGDSKALLVTQGNLMQIVQPHKPELPSERKRIEDLGGSVMKFYGLYRVNGALSVSRAIGDSNHKPYVSSDPDIVSIPLTGNEDFLILGCDGLWDHVTEDDVAFLVYKQVREHPDKIDQITKDLVALSQIQGSVDNISVIVVFLKDPHKISTSSWPSAAIPSPLENMETAYDNSNGAEYNNSNEEIFQKPNILHDFGIDMDFKNTTNLTDNLNNKEIDGIDDDLMNIKSSTENADFIFGNGSVPHPQSAAGVINTIEQHATNIMSDFTDNDNDNNLPPPSPIDVAAATSSSFEHHNDHHHNDGEEEEEVAILIPPHTNGKRHSDQMEQDDGGDDDDFGPETDVDTIDESMVSSPLSPATNSEHLLINQNNQYEENIDETNSFNNYQNEENNKQNNESIENIITVVDNDVKKSDLIDDELDNQMLTTKNNPFSVQVTNELAAFGIDDNKYLETVIEDVNESIQSAKKGIDFSEKKEFSFEREEYEKELDNNGSVTIDEQLLLSKEIIDNETVAQLTDEFSNKFDVDDTNIQQQNENEQQTTEEQLHSYSDDHGHDSFIVPEPEHEPIVDHSTAVNVVVPESGEDSEDEWNYIKVQKNSTENQNQELITTPSEEVENFNKGVVEESHALLQALAQPEEACSELLNTEEEPEVKEEQENISSPVVINDELSNHQEITELAEAAATTTAAAPTTEDEEEDVDDPEILEIESNAAAAKVAAKIEQLVGVVGGERELTEEEMASQLNPDAKEFVPTSPQRTTPTSPNSCNTPLNGGTTTTSSTLDNGLLHLIQDNDLILAQSPRKGPSTMDNDFDIPTENDFNSDISKCPKEFDGPMSPDKTKSPASRSIDFDETNGTSDEHNHLNNGDDLRQRLIPPGADLIIAQSPLKSVEPMDDFDIPTENDFDTEISKCPKELDGPMSPEKSRSPVARCIDFDENNVNSIENNVNGNNGDDRPGSSSSQYSYQEMNLKEAMHGDEKQEYAPEENMPTPDISTIPSIGDVGVVSVGADDDDLSPTSEEPISEASEENKTLAAKFMREQQDPMSMSFYNDGTSESANPFAVDLNAVHVLPQNSDDEEDRDINEFNQLVEEPYFLHHNDGQQFAIQDTEFGMKESASGGADTTETIKLTNGHSSSAPAADSSSNDEHEQISLAEKELLDKQETELSSKKDDDNDVEEQPSSIVQVVQEMATEITSLLNDVTLNDQSEQLLPVIDDNNRFITSPELDAGNVEPPTAVASPQFEAEHFVEDIKNDFEQNKYIDSGLSPVASEYVLPTTENLIEQSAQSPLSPSAPAFEFSEVIQSNEIPLLEQQQQEQQLPPIVDDIAKVENIVIDDKINDTIQPEAIVEQEIPTVTETKPNDSDLVPVVATIAAVGAVAAVAATAATVAVSKKPTTSTLSAKTTTTKKPEPKKSTLSSTTTTAAKKLAPTTTTTTAKKLPSTTSSTAAATKSSAAPIARPRTSPGTTSTTKTTTTTSKPGVSSTTTSSTTSTTRKPLGGSATTTVKKTTTTTTSASSRPTSSNVSKTNAPLSARTLTSKTTTTTASASTGKLGSSTTASSAPKPLSARAPITRPTTAPASSAGAATTAKTRPSTAAGSSAKTTSSTRTTSAALPKSTTDKVAKDLANKTTNGGVTKSNPLVSPRTGSTTLAAKKSPTGAAKPLVKPTTTTTSSTLTKKTNLTGTTTTTTSSSSAATSKKSTTISSRVSLAPPSKRPTSATTTTTTVSNTQLTGVSPIRKRVPGATSKLDSNKTTTTVVKNGSVGKIIEETTATSTTATTILSLNGDDNKLLNGGSGGNIDGDNKLINGENNEEKYDLSKTNGDTNLLNEQNLDDDILHQPSSQQIIDLSAD